MTGREPLWSCPPFEVTVEVAALGGHFYVGIDPDPGIPVLAPSASGHLVTPQTSCVAVSCATGPTRVDVLVRSVERPPPLPRLGAGCVESSLETGTGWFGLYGEAYGRAVELPTLVRGPGWYRLRIHLIDDQRVEVDIWPEDRPRPEEVLKAVELDPAGTYIALTGVAYGGGLLHEDQRPGIHVQRALQLSIDGRRVDDWSPAYTPGGDGVFRDVGGVPVAIFGTDGANVPVEVEHRWEPPEPDSLDQWEAVVEITVVTDTGSIRLADTAGRTVPLPELAFRGPGAYRIRWHADGRDSGSPVERHHVVVWPAEPADGRVLRLDDQLGRQLTYIPEPPPPEPALPAVEMVSTATASWAMTVRLRVEYSQYQILTGPDVDLDEPLLSPTNGLAELRRSHVSTICGTHHGTLALHVERHEAEPQLDDGWEEILEFSGDIDEHLVVSELMGGWLDLPPLVDSPGTYRVRLHARGRDAARDAQDVYGLYEHHALLVWPAPLGPVQLLRANDDFGRMWRQQADLAPVRQLVPGHRVHVGTPTSASPDDLVPQAAPEVFAARQRDWRLEHHQARIYAPVFVEVLGRLESEQQRAVARFLVHRAFTAARLDELLWVPPALEAMDRGDPLPPPFHDLAQLFSTFWPDPRRPESAVPPLYFPRPPDSLVSQQAVALPLPITLGDAELGLEAVLDVLYGALMVYGGDRYGVLLDEIATAFPELDQG